MRADKERKKIQSQKAQHKYFLKHSTLITRETRVYNSVILRVLAYYKKGLNNNEIASKVRKSRHIVKDIIYRFTVFGEPIKDLELMLPKKVFQPYNKHGIVSCFCGKLHPIEQACIETIKTNNKTT